MGTLIYVNSTIAWLVIINTIHICFSNICVDLGRNYSKGKCFFVLQSALQSGQRTINSQKSFKKAKNITSCCHNICLIREKPRKPNKMKQSPETATFKSHFNFFFLIFSCFFFKFLRKSKSELFLRPSLSSHLVRGQKWIFLLRN